MLFTRALFLASAALWQAVSSATSSSSSFSSPSSTASSTASNLSATTAPAAAASAGSSLLPSSYPNPTFQQSQANVDADSLASIHALLNLDSFPPPGWVAENGFLSIAQWDAEHGTRTFYNHFLANQTHYAANPGGCYFYWQQPLADCFNDDSGWAALTVLAGYEAYGDRQFLDWAESMHVFLSNHGFINQTVIDWGYLKGTHYANNTLQPTCNGQSMYGGVYWMNGDPNTPNNSGASMAAADPAIDSGSTANYALLSAKLCEITGNQSYCSRAYDALQFMDRFTVDPSNGLVQGHIYGNNCSQDTRFVKPDTTGIYLNAYAVVAKATTNGNATALGIAQKTALECMTNNIWNSDQGILGKGNNSSAHLGITGIQNVLVRSLKNVYQYMDADVQDAIRQYVNIQYWSLVNYDSNNPEKPLYYGADWQGPYDGYTGSSQVQTVDVFNALSLNPASAFPSSNSTSKPVITA